MAQKQFYFFYGENPHLRLTALRPVNTQISRLSLSWGLKKEAKAVPVRNLFIAIALLWMQLFCEK